MKLLLSHDFPHSPPKGYFMTKIFHPNIATNGEICVNTLKKDWNPSLGLRHVLIVVRCLLIEPFPESALNEQAGKMLLENYEEYARHARWLSCGIILAMDVGSFQGYIILAMNVGSFQGTCEMSCACGAGRDKLLWFSGWIYTGIHAKPKPKFKSGAISESTTALNVDQTNSAVLNVDQKNTAPGAALPLPSPLTPTTATRGNNQDQHTAVVQAAPEIGISGSAAATPAATTTLKKEGGLMKVQADKKKMDARKRSLKRL
ncbi:hypothetical protein JRO89_XS12G0199400 [Xanthoceras sorbifolium]|uniref:UBC core domain-containing protein n=1 Tax=Xanthoceras sorbifolium TaxID=99658 RepID=A0ABQ8HD60_9ROSI|nr:hypothetical protein JRO89_XS12G0199400 [Xanthoceras sorbifolium]